MLSSCGLLIHSPCKKQGWVITGTFASSQAWITANQKSVYIFLNSNVCLENIDGLKNM